ncbi:hypothetical protein ACFYOF_16875 [Streptomyces sp. NPDC007148]|uniref:hypothetical protein n=1 Tax=Streptomyces sp. NPDC007148 TaxID=3364775 RepID=UPI0036AE4147
MAIEMGDWAGWVGGVAGVAAFVTSIFGVVKSSDANRIARQANAKSDQSNNIARESNDLATEANQIAEAANGIAREANDLAHRQERRSTESHAVQWDGSWIGPGQFALDCRGSSVAWNVVARVTVDGEEAVVERERVVAPDRLIFDFPAARRALERERREYAEARRASSSALYGAVVVDELRFRNHSIEEWVHWKTETSAPKEHHEVWRLATLGDLG